MVLTSKLEKSDVAICNDYDKEATYNQFILEINRF